MPVMPKELYDAAMEQMKREMAEAQQPPRVTDRYIHDFQRDAPVLIRPMPLKQAYFGESPARPHAPPEPEIDIEAEDDKLTS